MAAIPWAMSLVKPGRTKRKYMKIGKRKMRTIEEISVDNLTKN